MQAISARRWTVVAALAVLAPVLPASGAIDESGPRVESEIKLSFPLSEADAVFRHLAERLDDGDELAGYGPLRVETSEELFTDVYFDTRRWDVYERGHGVRHRAREIPGEPTHRKAGRQLVQIKTVAASDDGSGVRRAEYKFEVETHREAGQRSAWDRHPLLGLVRLRDRGTLHHRIAALGVRPEDLAPALTLEQRRRRVYVSDPQGPLATATVDEVTARKALWMDRSAEVELELNEVRFTEADAAERDRMEAFARAIRADLLGAFEAMRQDQVPKYQKAVARLAEGDPVFRAVGALHVTQDQQLLAATLIGVVTFAAIERRRRRKRRPTLGTRGRRTGWEVARRGR